ncbi:PAS domain-containing sensor histidine kinase [Sphaerotilus sp.]|uniref:sensor histidine kinase n=1 Tax=Sphaerotilus sp. TaxID=2093942 RepID=UPI0034E243B4
MRTTGSTPGRADEDSGFARSEPVHEETWFATLGFGMERTQSIDLARGDTVPSGATPAPAAQDGPAHRAPAPPSDEGVPPPRRRRIEPPASFQRIFRAFTIARALLGLLLLGIQGLVVVYLGGRPVWAALLVCGAQVLAALAMLAWPVPPAGYMAASGHLRSRWALATIGVDLLAFTLLLFTVGPAVNAAALYMLPVLMAATLMTRRHAYGVASGVVLLLLAAAWWGALTDVEMAAALMQAGIAGGGVLTIAMLAGQLSDRLARQEVAARSTLELARQQARLNRLMIEEMQDGVMVADRDGRVQAANPAALQFIGAPVARRFMPFDLHDLPAWQPLRDALVRGYARGVWPEGGQELSLRLGPAGGDAPPEERPLRVRMRFTRRHGARSGEALCVLFLEDVRTLRLRARQEKLAAMGRVSAGIAHEIRNPLAAIAQANALLAEDLTDPGQQRLSQMVADNVERLQRIVDDVAEVSPGGSSDAPVIELGTEVARLCADWARTAGLPGDDSSALFVDTGDEPLPVRFDPEHLRRVLVNLLDNALRHGSRQPQAVWARVAARAQGRIELSVASDGAVIAPDVEPHLFEPFFSTRSRGTGLGLYICRELCARYGASIDFRPRGPGARHRNVFLVAMPRVAFQPPEVSP